MSRILRVLIPLLLLVFSQGISAYAQAPQAGFMADDTVVCVNNTITFTDTTIIGSDSIATWEWTFGDGGTSSLQHPTYFYVTGGQYDVTLIVTDSAGQKDTASSVIWVLSARAVQNIVRICSPATSATISAYSAVGPGVTGTWFTASSGVIATPLDTTTLVTGLVSGSYIFFWVVSDGFCSAADQVTVIVDQPIAATAGPDQTVCSLTGTATLAGNNPSPGTGLWTTTSSATITTPTLRNTTVTGLTTAGTYTFVWTVTRGACVNSDTMQIVVSPPVTPNAGTDLQSCSNNPVATLTGSSPAPGSALWTTTGSAVIASPTAATTNVSALTNGVNTFIYTVTNGACVLRDTVLVTVITIATANAGTDRQVCTATGTTSVTGSAPGAGTPAWSAVSVGTIVTPNAVTTSITGLTTPGFYSFVYTITNGICVSRDTMVVIVRAPVVANAGTDQTLCAATTATLAGNSAAPGTGLWTTTGSAVITTPSSATSGVSNLASGNNTFIWTATYGACVTRDTVIIRVDTTITANAGADQQICQTTTSVTLTANNPSPGTGLWTRTNGGTITSPTSSTTTITALTPGVHGFIWTITNGACVTRDTLFVTVSTQIPSNAGLDQSICQGSTTSLSGNIPTPGTGLWSTSSAATITSPASATSVVSGFTVAGNYDFIWTVTNGACVLRDTVRIVVDSAVAANAGTDQTFCSATTATLAGNTATPGTGVWSTTGAAVITTPASPTSGVTGLTTGTNTFIWTITNGQCIRRDTVNINVSAPVTANAGSDQQICATTGSVALTGNSPSPGTALWTTTSSATIATPTAASTTVSGLSTAGTYTFVYTITNGACISRDTVVITVSAQVIANAGADQAQCATTTATLAGNAAAPGSGLWTTTGSATITTPASPTSAVSNLATGNNTFIWTITNGACVSRDTVVIRVDNPVVANAGFDQQICQSSGSAILFGNSPSPGNALWTTSTAATIVSPTASATAVTGLTLAGNYSFVYTITNGTCIRRDTVVIAVDSLVTANAGTDQLLCATTVTTLAANAAAPGTGSWTTTGFATIVDPNLETSGVTDLAIGNNVFIWEITNGACFTDDTVIVRVDSALTAIAGADQQICATSGSVILSGNNASPGTSLWTTTSSAIIANPTSASTAVSGMNTAGTYTFVYTITNGTCVGSDTIVVTVDNNVVANAGTDQTQCSLTTATLAANAALPGSGLWTTTGSAIIATPASENSGVSNLSSGDNIFIWTITNGSCVSEDTVIVRVDSLIAADAGTDQSLCIGNTITLNAVVPSQGSGVWTALNGGTLADSSQANTTVAGLTTDGTYNFVWTVTNGTCVSTDTVALNLSTLIQADAGADAQFCQNQTVSLNAVAPSAGTAYWTALNGGTFSDSSLTTTTVSGLNAGLYGFVWSVTNGSCTTTDTVFVTVDSLVIAAAGTDQVICATDGQVVLNATDVTPYSGSWSTNASGTFADPFAAATTFTGLNTTGVYEFIWSVNNGTCTTTDTMLVTVDSSIAAVAGADQSLCETTLSTTLAATPEPGGYWSTTGTALISDTLDAAATVSNLSTGVNEFIWTVVNGVCTTSDTIIITVFPQVTPANAGTDSSACSAVGILLNGNVPLVGSGVWSTSSTAVIADPLNPTSSVSGLSGGIYDFVWTVSNGGCISTDTVTFNVAQSPVADAGTDQFVTSGTLVNLGGSPTAVSGIAPFVYAWTPGTLVSDSVIANPTYTANATQTFVITLTDSTGCSATDSVTIFLNNPPVAVNDTAYLCMDGILVATVTANDYDIDGDSLTLSILTPPVTGSAVISSAGVITYTPVNGPAYVDSLAYVICDNNPAISLCDTAWLYINVMSLPNITSTATGILCFGDTIGGVDITVTNGVTPYAYVWSTTDTTEDIIGVPAGIYTVSVTDSMGCMASHTDTVSGPTSALLAQSILQNVNCHGDSTGAIDLSVSGGTPGYQFSWNTTDTTEDLSGLPAGIYTVLVTDTNGCTLSLSDTIVQPDSALAAILSITDVQCASDTNGLAVVTASGGTAAYTYLWSTGSVTDTLTALQVGIYTVTVTDAAGCNLTLTDTVQAVNPPIVITAVTTSPFCLGGVTGTITASVSGGTSPFTYSWSNGDTTNVADSLTAGTYDLTVTDSVGCIMMYNTVLNDSSSIAITMNDSVLCAGDTALLSVPVYPGVQYQWYFNGSPLNGDTLNTYAAIAAGSYSLYATASCGLFIATPVNIQVNLLPTADAGSDQSVLCDETVTLTATGGVTYSWSPASIFSDSDSSTTTATTNVTTTLVVTVTDTNGCSATDSLLLTVNCAPLTIPSGFSPNSDGVNDFFVITAVNRYPGSLLRVYSRWGSLVYEKAFYDNSWNGFSNVDMTPGEELPDGTYYYVFDPKDGSEVLKGYVIIRRQ